MITTVKDLFFRYGVTEDQFECLWMFLRKSYCRHTRKYHNLNHIAKCLDNLAEYPMEEELGNLGLGTDHIQRAKDVIAFSIIFHDIVYDTCNNFSKTDSARIARIMLSTHEAPPKIIEQVNSCIMATQHRSKVSGILERIICDIDLAWLAAPYNEFEMGICNIREEYNKVPDEEFNRLNRNLLEAILYRPIYQTEYFQNKYEEKATKNIIRFLGPRKK